MKKQFYSSILTRYLLVILGLLFYRLDAQTYYSSFTSPTSGTQYTYSVSGLCIGCAVNNPSNAASLSLNDSAKIYMTVGAANSITARLKLTDSAMDNAGVLVSSNTGLLNLTALNAIVLRTYKAGILRETFVGVGALGLSLFSGGKQKISAATTKSFDEVEFSINNGVSAIWDINLFYAFGTTLTPLQVELYKLGTSVDRNSIHITWSIKESQRFKRFRVMHSNDGRSFDELGTVEVTAEKEGVDSFSYEHEGLQRGDHYYYIVMESPEGTTGTSKVIYQSFLISKPFNRLVSTFPNPATDRLVIYVSDEVETIDIFNSRGETIIQQMIIANTTTELNVEYLPAGAYFIKAITFDGIPKTYQFIVN